MKFSPIHTEYVPAYLDYVVDTDHTVVWDRSAEIELSENRANDIEDSLLDLDCDPMLGDDGNVYAVYFLYGERDRPACWQRLRLRYWYAIQRDNDDNDWGTGSYDKREAIAEMQYRYPTTEYPDAHIAVIDNAECVMYLDLDREALDRADAAAYDILYHSIGLDRTEDFDDDETERIMNAIKSNGSMDIQEFTISEFRDALNRIIHHYG